MAGTKILSAATPVPTSLGPAAYTSSNAGYAVGGGWNFRYVQATVKVPAVQKVAGNSGIAGIGLYQGAKYLSQIVVLPGGGAGSVRYADLGYAKTTKFALAPKVGDLVQISIYRDKHGADSFMASDLTTGKAVKATVYTKASLVPKHATVNCWIDNSKVVPPTKDLRIWAFTDMRVTSYNGTRGFGLFGPWMTYKMIDTTTGTRDGHVVIYPSETEGTHFGAWLNGH